MFINYNSNPLNKRVDDCAIRAVAKALDITWDEAFDKLSVTAKGLADRMDANVVVDTLLRSNGFVRFSVPNTCPYCYTFEDFCREHDRGVYVLATGNHLATVVNGDLYDTSDTSRMIPIYYYRKDK